MAKHPYAKVLGPMFEAVPDRSPGVVVNGRQFYQIEGIWCAEAGGVWRSAYRLGSTSINELLTEVHRINPGLSKDPAGQQSLEVDGA